MSNEAIMTTATLKMASAGVLGAQKSEYFVLFRNPNLFNKLFPHLFHLDSVIQG